VRLRESWRHFKPDQVRDFLRAGHEGRDHPSRSKTVELLEGMTSVLDVGCGTGVMFELIRERRPELDYLGIDVTPQFVAAARERFPADAQRFREGSLYELDRLPGPFERAFAEPVGVGWKPLACRRDELRGVDAEVIAVRPALMGQLHYDARGERPGLPEPHPWNTVRQSARNSTRQAVPPMRPAKTI